MNHAALISLAVLVACAPLYTRTKSIKGNKYSAAVTGKRDDTAQVELNKRARESCGGTDSYELFCTVPTADGEIVYWTCFHPSILPSCPPIGR